MMLGGKHDVLLSRGLCQSNPGFWIEFDWIESATKSDIVIVRKRAVGHHDRPGCFHAGDRVRSPMDEHPELGALKPPVLLRTGGLCPDGKFNTPHQAQSAWASRFDQEVRNHVYVTTVRS